MSNIKDISQAQILRDGVDTIATIRNMLRYTGDKCFDDMLQNADPASCAKHLIENITIARAELKVASEKLAILTPLAKPVAEFVPEQEVGSGILR